MVAGGETQTLISTQRDFVEWRQGRHQYAVWAINLDSPEIQARCDLLAANLGEYLLENYCRQAHLTLAVCGFPAALPQLEDDYSVAEFALQVLKLSTEKCNPFRIEIGRPDSFASAVYLSVIDPEQGISALHQALSKPDDNKTSHPYTPHVTFGLYRRAVPLARIQRLLGEYTNVVPLSWQVSQLSLMTYDAAIIGGALTEICRFDLASHCLLPRRAVRR